MPAPLPFDPPPPEPEDFPPYIEPEAAITEVEVIEVLLGPDGEPIAELLSRAYVPFGFGLGDRTPTRWRHP